MKVNISDYTIKFTILIVSLLISLGFAEVVVRQAGYQPRILRSVGDQKIEPGGRLHANHSILGYTHLPGAYTVTFQDVYTVHNTHLDNTLRITHPLDSYDYKFNKEEIWIFGGSFTYGWSIDDTETFPWLIQERFPSYEVVNFGVGGYGTVHSFLQFQEAIKIHKKPQIVIVAYADFHDERNAFLRSWRKRMLSYDSPFYLKTYPYARLDAQGNIVYHTEDIEYNPLPLMEHSAFINLMDEAYITIEDYFIDTQTITKGVVKDFATSAQNKEITFILAGIVPEAQPMLAYIQTQNIMVVDMSIDLDIPGNQNLPYDSHPSAIAHQQYAEKLILFLEKMLE